MINQPHVSVALALLMFAPLIFCSSSRAPALSLSPKRTASDAPAKSQAYDGAESVAISGYRSSQARGGVMNTAQRNASPGAIFGPVALGLRRSAVHLTMLDSRTRVTTPHSFGGTAPPPLPVTKSIRRWVSCNDQVDESDQLEQALSAAAYDAFTLLIDCPVRFHTGPASLASIPVPDGVTVAFADAGEFLIGIDGPPALTVSNPAQVHFINWTVTYL